MKKLSYIITCGAMISSMTATAYADELWESFLNPSLEARTKVWWFHGETETTKEGIDADLQAFKNAGIGGVVFYDQTHGNQEGACASLSPEWWEMLKYAAMKAKELGLTFDMASTNGYVAGGPWITPEYDMKKIVTLRPGEPEPTGFKQLKKVSIPIPDQKDFIDTLMLKERVTVTDNQPLLIPIDLQTPRELRTISYTVKPRGKGADVSMNIPGKPQNDYFGAMYILFPPIGELESSDDGINWAKVTSLRGIEDVIGHKSKQRTISHRKTDDSDIYFVYNHSDREYRHPISLRTDRHLIEIWDPLTIERTVPLDETLILKPYASAFIIAR